MVSQILNFGLPAPIDVQVVGNDLEGNQRYANALLSKLKYVTERLICGSSSALIELSPHESRTYESRATCFTAHDIAQNLLVSLSGSFQTSPTFGWTQRIMSATKSPRRRRQYRTNTCRMWKHPVTVQTQLLHLRSWPACINATWRRNGKCLSHNWRPVRTSLVPSLDAPGAVAETSNKIIDSTRQKLPPVLASLPAGSSDDAGIHVRSLSGLASRSCRIPADRGNFQSWLDPFS